VSVPIRSLANGTFAENGSRTPTGSSDSATFSGTVTYCADLEQPSAACDGSSPSDHYVYAVSSLGASVLVSAPQAQGPPPTVGAQVQVGVHIGNPFTQIPPSSPTDWAADASCSYNEQTGLPSPAVTNPELTQASISTTAQQANASLEAVVQAACSAGSPPTLVLSADDIREAGRDLTSRTPPVGLAVPPGIDLTRLTRGEAVQVALGIAGDGTLSIQGITSDQGTVGADDASQGQGTLTGS
jgi:hypothetical protein